MFRFDVVGMTFLIVALSFGIIGYKTVKLLFGSDAKSRRLKQEQELAQIHSELRALKEHVVKVQEYVTDIYIYHYNTDPTSKLMNPELYQEPGKESE